MKNKNQIGFTLIEILIWMAVMAVTSTALVWLLPTSLKHARDAKRKQDLIQISRGLEAYYNLAGQYPESLPDCYQPIQFQEEIALARTPCSPNSNQPYRYVINQESDSNSWYKLYTNLEVTTDPVIFKLHCSNGCGPDCAYNYGRASSNTTLDNCALKYVCAPGGGREGYCEVYEDPERSECPEIYLDTPDCNQACSDPKNRCANASGKRIPE